MPLDAVHWIDQADSHSVSVSVSVFPGVNEIDDFGLLIRVEWKNTKYKVDKAFML